VPRHVARLDTRIVVRLVVDYSYTACLGASARRAAHRLSSITSPTPCDRVPRHVAWLVTRLVAPLVVDYSASRRFVVDYSASRRLVFNNSASRRLIVDYVASAARPGASARRADRHAARRAARRQLLRLAQARRRLLRLHHASGCHGTTRVAARG
jgi:hypothetical protein